MLSLDILERLDKKWTGGAHKAPYLYRFRQTGEKLIPMEEYVR
jgi:hypothetical protein